MAFLQSLGAELPPRVRERVRTLPYQITIQCDLRPQFRGSSVEECEVRVVAEAPDGQRQSWTGYNWLHETPEGRSSKARRREPDHPL